MINAVISLAIIILGMELGWVILRRTFIGSMIRILFRVARDIIVLNYKGIRLGSRLTKKGITKAWTTIKQKKESPTTEKPMKDVVNDSNIITFPHTKVK